MYTPQSAILQSLPLFTPSRHHEFTTRKRGEGVRQAQSVIPTTRIPLSSRRISFRSQPRGRKVRSRQLGPTPSRSTRRRRSRSLRGRGRHGHAKSSRRRRPRIRYPIPGGQRGLDREPVSRPPRSEYSAYSLPTAWRRDSVRRAVPLLQHLSAVP